LGDLDTRFRPAQRRRQDQKQNRAEIVLRIRVARIANLSENLEEGLHGASPEAKGLFGVFLQVNRRRSLYSDAIPLMSKGGPFLMSSRGETLTSPDSVPVSGPLDIRRPTDG
ncbi:hypothetical protein, partial [Azospirillum sp. sgz302134]